MITMLLALVAWQSDPPPEVLEPRVSVSGHLGMAFISGGVGKDFFGDYIMDYPDLFQPGVRIGLEGSVLFPSGAARVGVIVGLDRYSFDGRTFTDDVGDTLRPDTMELFTVLGGVRFVMPVAPHWLVDTHAGLLLVHYDAVDAVFNVGGVEFAGQELFAATNTGGFDMGGRIAYDFGRVTLDLGFGLLMLGPPRRGADVTSAVDPMPPLGVYLEVGVTATF
jgi:hypothetical protein